MELKATLKDYTATEFHALVDRIWAVDMPKRDHDRLISHFDAIAGHPQGADLLFYSQEESISNSSYLVVHQVREWHRKQGVTAFKEEAVSAPPPRLPTNPVARGMAEVQKIAADVALLDQTVERAFTAFEQGVRYFRGLHDASLNVSTREANMRMLELTQHETLMAINRFKFVDMRIEMSKNSAQSSLTYARSDHAQWQNIVQQITATHHHYLARLTAINQRHRIVHDQAEALLILAKEQLVSSRNLEEPGRNRIVSGSLLFAHKRPAILLEGKSPALLLSQQVDLLKAIRSAVGEFTWQITSGEETGENQIAAVLQFEFSSRADAKVFGLGVPLVELMHLEGQEWQSLASDRSEVDMPFRMSTARVPAKPGSMFMGLREIKKLEQVYISATRRNSSSSKVRVRAAKQDGSGHSFTFTADGAAPVSVSWSSLAPVAGNVPAAPAPLYRLGFVYSSPVPMLEPLVNGAQIIASDDYIVVFPPESGIEPVYVMLAG